MEGYRVGWSVSMVTLDRCRLHDRILRAAIGLSRVANFLYHQGHVASSLVIKGCQRWPRLGCVCGAG